MNRIISLLKTSREEEEAPLLESIEKARRAVMVLRSKHQQIESAVFYVMRSTLPHNAGAHLTRALVAPTVAKAAMPRPDVAETLTIPPLEPSDYDKIAEGS